VLAVERVYLQRAGRRIAYRAAVEAKRQAKGSFDVKLQPLEPHHKDERAGLGRRSIDKQFHGDLEATMTRGEPHLNIVVVPDSGSDELTGLRGVMKIVIADGGAHFYELDYELAA
jgi:hypothetical protein